MSIPVDLAALRAQIARFGARAFLVSSAATGPPHVSSVVAVSNGDELVMGCGRTTRTNVETRPEVTLLWPAGPDPGYCLIVDGVAAVGRDETLTVRPTNAVLHRLASAPADLPRCLPVDPGER